MGFLETGFVAYVSKQHILLGFDHPVLLVQFLRHFTPHTYVEIGVLLFNVKDKLFFKYGCLKHGPYSSMTNSTIVEFAMSLCLSLQSHFVSADSQGI